MTPSANLALLVLLLLTAACDQTGIGSNHERGAGSGPRVAIRMGTFSDAIDYAPYYVARTKGWFASAPDLAYYDVEHVGTLETRQAISSALRAGDLTTVFAAVPPLVVTRAEGRRVSIVALSCSLRQEVAVRDELPISTVEDLQGKRVAVMFGTSSHYGLLEVFRQAGIATNDELIFDMLPPAARAAFVAKEVDAWAVWPPFVEHQQTARRARVVVGGDAKIHSAMAVSDSFIETHPAATQALASVLQAAKVWIQTHPEEAQLLVSTHLDEPLDVVRLAWGKHNWGANLDTEVLTDIQAKSDFLAREGLTRNDAPVSTSELIDSRLRSK